MLDQALEVSLAAAREAGEAIIAIYKTDVDIDYKSDTSPVTAADHLADEIIFKRLKETFPDIWVLSEESKDNLKRLDEAYVWIVDPLDGTKEFINHTDEFTVNIALVYNHEPIVGVVYAPILDLMFYSIRGGGSFVVEKGKQSAIHVSQRNDRLRILSSKYHQSKAFLELMEGQKDRIDAIIPKGSSLKGCLIAKGDAECYYRFGLTSQWDTAAMELIVKEAGGVFLQLDHTPMIYNREDTLNRKGFYVINDINNELLTT